MRRIRQSKATVTLLEPLPRFSLTDPQLRKGHLGEILELLDDASEQLWVVRKGHPNEEEWRAVAILLYDLAEYVTGNANARTDEGFISSVARLIGQSQRSRARRRPCKVVRLAKVRARRRGACSRRNGGNAW